MESNFVPQFDDRGHRPADGEPAEVEAVLARELLTGGHCFFTGDSFQYKLKWRGWSMRQTTWESESNCVALGVEEMIRDFNNEHGIRGKSTLCCGNGQIQLAPLTTPPDALAQILKSADPSAKDFRSHLRTYNNSLSMASMSCKQHVFAGGVPAMRVGGEIKHYIGSMEPASDTAPQFISTYVYDPDHEHQLQARLNQVDTYMSGCKSCPHRRDPYWCRECDGLGVKVLEQLQQMMHTVNPHAQSPLSWLSNVPPCTSKAT